MIVKMSGNSEDDVLYTMIPTIFMMTPIMIPMSLMTILYDIELLCLGGFWTTPGFTLCPA